MNETPKKNNKIIKSAAQNTQRRNRPNISKKDECVQSVHKLSKLRMNFETVLAKSSEFRHIIIDSETEANRIMNFIESYEKTKEHTIRTPEKEPLNVDDSHQKPHSVFASAERGTQSLKNQ